MRQCATVCASAMKGACKGVFMSCGSICRAYYARVTGYPGRYFGDETMTAITFSSASGKPVSKAEVHGYLRACDVVEGSQQWEAILAGVPFDIDDSVLRFERIA